MKAQNNVEDLGLSSHVGDESSSTNLLKTGNDGNK